MGWNTTVLVLNDCLHEIEKDKDFGQKLSDAIRASYPNTGERKSVGQAATVVATHHADEVSVIAVGGNYATHLDSVYGRFSHHKEEDQIEILKRVAEHYGFTLVEKRKKP